MVLAPGRLPACGFYLQRDLGLYCRDIESRVAGRGEARPLTEWCERLAITDIQLAE
jgi:hypothetical protein